jgi:hypothetical protein
VNWEDYWQTRFKFLSIKPDCKKNLQGLQDLAGLNDLYTLIFAKSLVN